MLWFPLNHKNRPIWGGQATWARPYWALTRSKWATIILDYLKKALYSKKLGSLQGLVEKFHFSNMVSRFASLCNPLIFWNSLVYRWNFRILYSEFDGILEFVSPILKKTRFRCSEFGLTAHVQLTLGTQTSQALEIFSVIFTLGTLLLLHSFWNCSDLGFL